MPAKTPPGDGSSEIRVSANNEHDKSAGTPPTRYDPPQARHPRRLLTISTRWHDNDVYGHVNNTVYYSYFDTIVNQFLIEADALDPLAGSVVVVETKCSHFASLTFSEKVHAGMRAAHIGDSAVRYEIALFSENAKS